MRGSQIDITALCDKVMQWSNVNTGTYNVLGLEKMASILMQEFSVLECEKTSLAILPIDMTDALGDIKKIQLGKMLRFWKRPKAPLQVLLLGHMDTVFDLNHPFQRATRKTANIISGPGVCDMKGGICILLEALKLFEKSTHKNNLGWEVIINPDEEIGSLGSGSYLMERAQYHHVGLAFEPAMDEQGTLAGVRAGSGKFTIVVRGIAAHAGRDFNKGINAILSAANIIQGIGLLNGQREGVTLNVGQIEGGGAVNVVPKLAIFRLDVRLQNQQDAVWVQENLNFLIEQEKRNQKVEVELRGGFYRKPKKLDEKTLKLYERLAEIAEGLDQTIQWKPSGGCSDGNNLSEAGLPNVDTLGVLGGKIHSDEEYILINSLIPRIQLTTALLEDLSQKGF